MTMWSGYSSSDEEFASLAAKSEDELRSADFDGPRYWAITAPPRDAPPPSPAPPPAMPKTFDQIARRALADPEFADVVRSDPKLCAAFVAEAKRRREAAARLVPIGGAFDPKQWAKDAAKKAVSTEKGIGAWARAHKRALLITGAIAAGLLLLGGGKR